MLPRQEAALCMHTETTKFCRSPGVEEIIRLLKVSANDADLENTQRLHSWLVELQHDASLEAGSALVHSYVRCASIKNAWSTFYRVHKRDVILWTTLITGYGQLGIFPQASAAFNRMHVEGEFPNHFTYASIIKASANTSDDRTVKQIHASLLEAGFASDATISNTLIDVYGKLGDIEHAILVFNSLPNKDVISWSAMISCFGKHERWRDTILLLSEMHQENMQPSNYTFVSILQACAKLKDLETCRCVHSQVAEKNWDTDVYLRSALLDTYMKCGCIKDAEQVLNNVTCLDLMSINAMISGYAQHALGDEAMMLFHKLQNEGLISDRYTFATILKACASVASTEEGTQIHVHLSASGIECDQFITSTLIDMYVKCGKISGARKIFDDMLERDVVLWNSILVSYTQEGTCQNAFDLFHQMQVEGTFADACTFVILLKACIGAAALVWGKQLHVHLVNTSLDPHIYVSSSLVDMYSKCGSLEDARKIFDKTQKRDVVAWNAIITAYAQQGHSKEVFVLFNSMEREGLEPSAITLGCVLSACRHGGLVEDGCDYFSSLISRYKIKPLAEHFGCIIDLFARVGQLSEAVDFLSRLPFKTTIEPWMALLAACKVHSNVEAAERAFKNIKCLEPDHIGAYILLSNVYAAAKKWDAVHSIRFKLKMMAVQGDGEHRELYEHACGSVEIDSLNPLMFVESTNELKCMDSGRY
ncbi:hypothetical protein KP509_02G049000 [Ceratopteris richardii]|uniref:Pentatricopeptide repeat-containing protein n=1 Tax=Ceratopteris richardii TaxID=49495 RepID=A0A8T2V961_CERRI|nr:hypothetical protein KP509_02G049000 [Ceratopteris richardii]